MDIDGGPNPEAIHHTLTAINGFHASLDFEDSHLAESQRIMQALHHAAIDESYPGREAIAGYVADALTWNARNTIESFIDGNHPDKYEDRDIPFPLSYADMNKARRPLPHGGGRTPHTTTPQHHGVQRETPKP